ncbi:ABC transporter substrate-binding protein [Bosea beijingensis]|jgi:iron complex transport system substrate-binding protein
MNLPLVLRRLRGACLLSIALAGAMASVSLAADRPARIVSLNMCTDELVLRLADPARIASVTWLSQDPRNANMAEAARRVPANHGLAEEVLGFKPDLVVAGAYTTRATVSLLGRVGVTVREFGVPRNLAEMKAQITEMADLLGEPTRGQALLEEVEQRLQALAARRVERPLRAVVLRPSGFTVGRGSLVDEILTRAGLVNIAAELGVESYGQIALETVALGRAEVLILNETPDGPPSLAHEILHHPVIDRLGARLKRVALPSRLWTCAGPSVLDAIEMLVRAVEEKS